MKRGSIIQFGLRIAAVVSLCVLSVPNSVGQATGYGFVRAITINHTLVPHTDQTSFPVLISGTYADLATTANGGNVQNSQGYDIIFTSDSAGQNRLDHEIDTYNAITGAVNVWVRIPTLSHTTDTTIYMWYGNNTVTTSQENKPGVWSNGFAAVYHLGNGSILGMSDSSASGYALAGDGCSARGGDAQGPADSCGRCPI